MTPVQAHRERALAQLAAGQAVSPAGVRSGRAATEYELMRAKLGVDLRRLKEIQSIERKIELKAELLPEYFAWVEGVIAADCGADDDILTHVMIWSIDVGAFEYALPLARYIVTHKLPLPDRFDRTAPTLICEEIAEAALKRFGQGEDFDAGLLDAVADIVEGQDIFDQVRAKLEKAQGFAAERSAAALTPDGDGPAGAQRAMRERALIHLRRALALDGTSGVKRRIELLERATRPAVSAEG